MNILIYCDSGYEYQVLIAMESFYTYHTHTSVKLYILGRKWNKDEIEGVASYIEKHGGQFIYTEIADELEKVPYKDKRTKIFFAHFLAPRLIPENRILCIDNDILFNENIEDVYNTDLTDKCICGALDVNNELTRAAVGLDDTSPIIITGFLVLNLAEMRKQQGEQKIYDFISKYDIYEYKDAIRAVLGSDRKLWELLYSNANNVYLHDQGAQAVVFKDSIKVIPPKYNVLRPLLDQPIEKILKDWKGFYNKEQVIEAKYRPAVIHFAGGSSCKPWKVDCTHFYKDLYYEYAYRLGITKEKLIIDQSTAGSHKFRKKDLIDHMPDSMATKIYKFYYFKARENSK